uniref:Uncharacterized protein n=1 Tax=viral metagenome TaxID=1070528 RepID=A0A6C0BLK1_9ZZZZ
MILKSERTNPLSPRLDVILYYTSSTLNMSELCSSDLLSTRRSAHHPPICKMIVTYYWYIDSITRTVSGSAQVISLTMGHSRD